MKKPKTKRKMFKTEHVYVVQWSDASARSTWTNTGDILDFAPNITTVGYLLSETDTTITLVQSISPYISEEGQIDGEFLIPKGCIHKKTRIHTTEWYSRAL